MALRLVIAPRAKRDIEDIVEYIAVHDEAASRRVLLQFEHTISRLIDRPYMGVVAAPSIGLRKMSVPPHIIFYAVYKDELQIVRVVHSARDTELASIMRRQR